MNRQNRTTHTLEPLSKAARNSMCSGSVLDLLQRYASEAAKYGEGTIVEIGAYQGGSTIALAMGIQKVGRGKVTSIDPHIPAKGVYGGKFSYEDHLIYLDNLERSGLSSLVDHLCTDSLAVAKDWISPIDLLWIDGDHSYQGVASDISQWAPYVRDQGIIVFDDVEPGSEVEAALRDYLPSSKFRLVEQLNHVVVLRKKSRSRTLYLCGGMQSSGSTLVSWCFLQRHDLDGVLDLDNALIQQDFSRVTTDPVWLKMTIGSFRLTEMVSLYEAQGWIVKPLLVQRDLTSVYQSLRNKPYGFDGATSDEPPILIRIQRYLEDLNVAHDRQWPILRYEDLICNPKVELQRICGMLGLDWDEAMASWPKNKSAIAYMENGNPSFHKTKQDSVDLLTAIAKYQDGKLLSKDSNSFNYLELMVDLVDRSPSPISYDYSELCHTSMPLPVVRYRGTQRQIKEQEVIRLVSKEHDYNRIVGHIVFGRLLRIWKRFINKSFPAQC